MISPVQASLIVHVSWDFLEMLVNSVLILAVRCPGKEKEKESSARFDPFGYGLRGEDH